MKIADAVIAFLFILLIVLSLCLFEGGGNEVLINASGREYRYPLSENRIINIEGPLGITAIEIKDGDAHIISSPCPNKTCLDTRMGNTVCCLPNRVLLTIGESDSEVDAYAY